MNEESKDLFNGNTQGISVQQETHKYVNVSPTCLQISYANSLCATKCETSHTFVKELVLPSAIESASIKFDDNVASQITVVPFCDSGAQKKAFRHDNRRYWPICGKNGAVGLNHLMNWQLLGGCRRSENCRSLKGN
jgi:hypothetical protein